MLIFNGKTIAHFGEIHPKIQKLFDIDSPVVCFSCYNDNLKQNKLKWTKELYPSVSKDFCFIVPDDFLSYKIIDAIYKELSAKSIRIFDIFINSLNEKSITIEVTFSDPTKTLSENEINEKYNKVVSIAKNFNAYIKGVQ